ncbi:MAG: LLM class flavin-dependent oxidoreductase [Actinomycetota bacterium]
MDVGLLTLGDWVTDPVTGVRRTEAERHRSIVDQAVAIEAAGFSSIHLGEHHFSEYILSSPALVLAAIAERTTDLRLSNGVALAANADPVRLAEEYATLDLLSGGRIEPCWGRGSIFPDVYTFFGQDAAEGQARMGETVRLVDTLWRSEGPVDWEGEFRAPLRAVEVHPKPMQRPRPNVWIGGGWSPDTVDLAVELGYWLMLPTVVGRWELFAPIVERYIEGWEAAGHDPADRRIGCCSHFHVAPTTEQARARWAPRYEAYMHAVADWIEQSGDRAGIPTRLPATVDFEELSATVAICGSPEEVLDRMGTAREMLQLDTQLLMLDLGGLPDGELYENIEMIGETIIPAVTDW